VKLAQSAHRTPREAVGEVGDGLWAGEGCRVGGWVAGWAEELLSRTWPGRPTGSRVVGQTTATRDGRRKLLQTPWQAAGKIGTEQTT